MSKRAVFMVLLLVVPLSVAQAYDDSWFENSKQWVQQLWQNDAKNWLERIDSAVLNNNYSGVIVLVQGGKMESLAVDHKMLNGKETLRLKTLSGVPRELLKIGGQIKTNALPKQYQRYATGGSNQGSLSQFAHAADYKRYRVKLAEKSRIAGRNTQVVTIQAVDDLRYSYRLWLDQETGLPLKVLTLDENNQTVEQMAFTQISIEPLKIKSEPATLKQSPALKNPFKEVKGFKLMAQEIKGNSQHYLYSDGLASVSLYIDPSKLKEQAQMKKDSVNGLILGNGVYRTVALGKVPIQTLELFLISTQNQP